MIPAIVLVEPRIPPNTGNVARTCAATGAPLHLIEPLGFSIEDRYLRRAGLDYWQHLSLEVHADWPAFVRYLADEYSGKLKPILAAVETSGQHSYIEIPTRDPLYLIFGPETGALPPPVLASADDHHYRIPMRPGQRSLNLGNAAALVLYDQLARRGFPGLG